MKRSAGRLLHATAATLAALVLLGPGPAAAETKARYRELFAEAIGKFLGAGKGNNICLPMMYFGSGPNQAMEINQRVLDTSASTPAGQGAQVKALEEAGLLTGTTLERQVNNKPETFRSYRRTDKGNEYFKDGRFCYARAELNTIVKWKGPAILGEYQIAWVYYTVKATHIADWATAPAVLAAFPTAKSTLQDEPDKLRQAFIDLTSEGWEVNEFSRVLQ